MKNSQDVFVVFIECHIVNVKALHFQDIALIDFWCDQLKKIHAMFGIGPPFWMSGD